MFSTVNKTLKPPPAVQLKPAGTTFFRKAGEESFFGGRQQGPSFFNAPVQAKLTVSTPDDPQEKEADAVADKVMRMPEPVSVAPQSAKPEEKMQGKGEEEVPATQPARQMLQAKKEQGIKMPCKPVLSIARSEDNNAGKGSELQVEEPGGYMVNRKNLSLYHSDILRQSGRGPPAASIPFEQTLASSKGGGSALPGDTKQFMESRFNADFSGVRVHTDTTAVNLSRNVNAQAFAHGNDIYFNSGKFSPSSTEGRTLLAHELTHTIQQGASRSTDAPGASIASKNIVSRKPGYGDQKEEISSIDPSLGSSTTLSPHPGLSNFSVASNGHIHPSGQRAPSAVINKSVEVSKKEPPSAEEDLSDKRDRGGSPVEAGPSEGVPSIPGKQRVTHHITPKIAGTTPAIQLKRITSPQADPAFTSVIGKIKTTSQKAKKHDPVTKKVKEAQSAAKPPPNEKESKAKDQKVAEMDQQPAGTFDEAKFKDALRAKIQALQLNSLQEAENFKANNGAAAVKGDATAQVSGETAKAAGGIEKKTEEAPATGNVTGKEVGPDPAAAADVATPAISGQQAAPKPVPAEDVSLQKDSQGLDKQMADAKVTDTQLSKSNEPKFAGALAAKKTAQVDAVKRPDQFRKDEKGVITNAQATAAGVSKTHLNAIAGAHKQKLGGVLSKQQEAKAKDEAGRAKVAADIEQKFNVTKTEVEGILSKLDIDVAATFDKGINDATKGFEDYVDREVHNFKVDRYLDHIGGSLLWAKDLLLGLPDEVNDIYKRGKDRYIKAMDVVINQVAKLVVGQLNAAKKRIAQGKQEIKNYVDSLPKNLQSIGAEAAKNIQSQFSELESNVNNKQSDLVDSLAAKYKAGLENVDKKIAEMKEANKGLVDKAIGAIKEVIDAIIEFKNMLLNVLARAAAAIELIIDDPIGFLGNLVAGVKQGIQNFVGNIATHLKNGLMGWLFGTLAQAGITMPKSFDAEGIISLVLQVLGLTYANIRSRAVNIVGEKVVAGLEKAAEIFIVIKNEGVGGLWRMIKEKVAQLKDTVIDAIKSFVTEKIIVAGITWLISLLNPASAFIKACKMIYDVIMFFVTRGKQIMDLVNAVIDSVTAIAKGQIGVAAKAVENALAKALPVAISFLASLLGLDGISEKIKAIIAKIQAPINAAIDWVINKAVGLVKAAGKLLGIGKEKDGAKGGAIAGGKPREKVLKFGGEGHHIKVAPGDNVQFLMASDEFRDIGTQLRELRSVYVNKHFAKPGQESAKDELDAKLKKLMSRTREIEKQANASKNDVAKQTDILENGEDELVTGLEAINDFMIEKFSEEAGTNVSVQTGDLIEELRADKNYLVTQDLKVMKDQQLGFYAGKNTNSSTQFFKYTDINNVWKKLKGGAPFSKLVTAAFDIDLSHSLFSGASLGEGIRAKLYGDWNSSAKSWKQARMNGALKHILNGTTYFISEMEGGEISPDAKANIMGKDVNLTLPQRASIDHVVPVAEHWTDRGGNNCNQSKRTDWFNDYGSGNLKIISRELNSTLGSKGKNYVSKTGTSFRGPGE